MKLKGLRWFIIGLIAIATVINYIDRNAMAVMWPEISRELGLSKDDYALLLTCFTLSYAFGQSLFGKILDAVGTRAGFTLAILVWSLSIAGHAFARTLLTFGILRATLGLSEAGAWPGAAKANALWFPATERAFAQGIFNAGASVGAIIAAPLIAFLFLLIGWKMVFLLIGVLGFVWIIPWLLVYRADPEKHPWLSEEERDYILNNRVSKDAPAPQAEYAPNIRQLLSHKESWSVILSRFFLDPIWWLFVSWLPIYLAETFGFDIKQIGLFAWVPFVGAAIGSLFGGALSGFLIRRGVSVGKARKGVILLGCVVMMPALFLCMNAATPLMAVLLIAVVLFGFQIAIGNIQTLPGDYFSGKSVGSLSGLGGTAANLGVLITTWIVPMATQVSFAPVFLMAGLLVPLSILSLLLLGGRVHRLAGRQS
ncbi:MFS transporter [Asticcacaulis sp. AND118]|uniref:MFS transporter n=1 Tax=Asticcacaulis sp. AND118 TaxID=2840468 RepID=UPI001CFFF065|nr:MFS transporter [Asticcacaulis sp. AND118]UDF05302.1 MFS transporter [Asticcacaulis sp. AND118]